jgi:Xaa-Pro aminopeptidase/Xaa-Pro dipeptidase
MLLAGVGEGARMFSEPTDRELEPGQFVRIDLNATLQGYYADLGRMAVVGEPTGEQSAAYDAHIELNRRILKAMRPGATCAEMFAVQQEEGRRLGVELLEQPSIGFGHAIGTNANDAPKLMASDATVLEEGMVFNIEPDVIGPDGERIHVEKMVLVGADGGELLTGNTDWSTLPRIRVA